MDIDKLADICNKLNIKTITAGGEIFFYASDLGKALNIKKVRNVIKNYTNTEVLPVEKRQQLGINTYKTHRNFIAMDNKMALLTLKGARKLIYNSRSIKAEEIAPHFGIRCEYKYVCAESQTLNFIIKAFAGEKITLQKLVAVGPPESCKYYRIDLYFEDYKIAVECDEHDHADRNLEKEIAREDEIRYKLGCKFVRYNPDNENMQEHIFDTINEIFRLIKMSNDGPAI